MFLTDILFPQIACTTQSTSGVIISTPTASSMERQVFTTEGPSRYVENIIVILSILKETFQLLEYYSNRGRAHIT